MDWLRRYGHVVSYEAGDVVSRQNDEAHNMFVLNTGASYLLKLE